MYAHESPVDVHQPGEVRGHVPDGPVAQGDGLGIDTRSQDRDHLTGALAHLALRRWAAAARLGGVERLAVVSYRGKDTPDDEIAAELAARIAGGQALHVALEAWKREMAELSGARFAGVGWGGAPG